MKQVLYDEYKILKYCLENPKKIKTVIRKLSMFSMQLNGFIKELRNIMEDHEEYHD